MEGEYITCRTSGSTGIPQEIKIKKQALIVSAKNTNSFFQLEAKDKIALCMSVDYIAGKMMIVRALIAGLTLAVYPVSAKLVEELDPCEFIALFPKQLQGLMNSMEGIKKLKQCQKILIGGAPISKPLEKQLKNNKISIFQSYGMTETVTHVALKTTGYRNEAYYKAIPGVSFKIVEDCLKIHYPEMQQNPIQTNDLVELKDTSQFKWIGRSDFIINSGGYKVSPENVEEKIQEILNVELMITGVPDTEFGEKVGLVLQGSKDSINIHKSQLKLVLHPYEVPKLVTFVHSFERTANGKLDRKSSASKIRKSAWEILL